jgi:hypothetical protein
MVSNRAKHRFEILTGGINMAIGFPVTTSRLLLPSPDQRYRFGYTTTHVSLVPWANECPLTTSLQIQVGQP